MSQWNNEEGTLRHGLKTNLKRSTRWVVGVKKVWGTRESESGNEVATEMVMAVGKMASGLILDNEASGQLNAKKGWWFLVKAPEKCLVEAQTLAESAWSR